MSRPLKGWPGVERARYVGRLYKRAAPTARDFVEIGPGESLASVIDLERFSTTSRPPGDYAIGYRGEILSRHGAPDAPLTRSADARVATRAHSHGALRSRQHPRQARRTERLAVAEPLGVPRPPADLQRLQRRAAGRAGRGDERRRGHRRRVAVRPAGACPENRRAGSPRYTQWFGDYDPARYATVTRGYANILDSLSGATLNYDCSCDEEGVFAYVYPFQLHDIYLCPTFFRANLLGTDSRAGTPRARALALRPPSSAPTTTPTGRRPPERSPATTRRTPSTTPTTTSTSPRTPRRCR